MNDCRCMLTVEIVEPPIIDIDVMSSVVHITDGEKYLGPYSVIPRALESTILATKNKFMTENLTVEKIPYTETSNISGLTVLIG